MGLIDCVEPPTPSCTYRMQLKGRLLSMSWSVEKRRGTYNEVWTKGSITGMAAPLYDFTIGQNVRVPSYVVSGNWCWNLKGFCCLVLLYTLLHYHEKEACFWRMSSGLVHELDEQVCPALGLCMRPVRSTAAHHRRPCGDEVLVTTTSAWTGMYSYSLSICPILDLELRSIEAPFWFGSITC